MRNRNLTYTIDTICANSGRPIKIKLDSELNISGMTEGASPIYCLVLINTDKMKETSIVDVF
ncbi:MAG: hypothetical protein GY799_22060 [Desulfobulbaceae bacterium]|nr:hypothetical protein [Desulfobulbaceae bacterium]